VLLVAFRPEDAYLIDLRPHESDGANWSELAILEVIVRNWPGAGILHPSNYVTGLVGGNRSDEDRRSIRSAGISTAAVEIDGQVWSAGGQSLMGDSMQVMRHCMSVSWYLSGYAPTEDELRAQLSEIAAKHDVSDYWRGQVEGEGFGFISEHLFVRCGGLLPL
jgi:hypothetical protein